MVCDHMRFGENEKRVGGDFFGFLGGAIQTHADPAITLPEGPPFYRFADREIASAVLGEAGFRDIRFSTVPVYWYGTAPEQAVEVIYKATVRTKMMLEAQRPEVVEKIHRTIVEGVEQFREDDHFRIALPAFLATAVKPTDAA